MAMAVMLFTSCLKNEEPQSLGTLREAKAELIKAQAAYKTAEIALINAQVAYQAALTEGVKVQNELAAQAVEAAKIDNQIKEVELAIKEAELEAEIAELEMELAQQQAELAELLMQMELAAAEHEAAMIEAMQDIAEAQQAYEQALKMMQAENLGLTAEEQAVIKGYIDQIRDLQDKAQDLMSEIAETDAELQNRVLDNDYESILADAEYDVYVNQYYAALMQAYAAQMEQILTSGEYEEVKAKAAEEEAHLALYNDSIDVYNKQLSTIEDQLIKLEADYDVAYEKYVVDYKDAVAEAKALWTEAYDEVIVEGMTEAVDEAVVPVKFEYDAALEAELKKVLTGTFKNGVYTGKDEYAIATYAPTKNNKPEKYAYEYTLKSSYTAVNAAFDQVYKQVYADLHISPAKIAEYEAIKAGATSGFAAIEKSYKANKALFDSIQPIAIAKANAYKVGADKDLQVTTKAAWTAYWEKDQAKVTIAEAEALRDAVVKYLKDRQELDAQAVLVNLNINGNNVPTPLASVLFNDYVAAKDLLVSYKADCQWALDRPSLTFANATKPEALLNQWNTLSKTLYGTPSGNPLVMPIEDYFQDFASQVVVKLDNDGKVTYDYLADKGVAKFDFEDMGYGYTVSNVVVDGVIRGYTVSGFCSAQWFNYHVAVAKQTAHYLIDLQEEVDAVLESINAHKAADPAAAFAELSIIKSTADGAMDVVTEALAEAEEELEAAEEQYLESIDEQIEALEEDIEAIEKAIDLIEIKANACEEILAKYMVLLNGMVPGGDFEDTADFEEFVAELVGEYLDAAEDYLEAAEEAAEYLERVQMGIDEATVAYENELRELTADLAELEGELELVLLQIEYFQELLNETINVFVGE